MLRAILAACWAFRTVSVALCLSTSSVPMKYPSCLGLPWLPSGNVITPSPSTLPFWNLPSKRIPSFRVKAPKPLYFPFSNSPSYTEPSGNLATPWPWQNPLRNCPTYFVPSTRVRCPMPCFLPSLFHSPSYVSPIGYVNFCLVTAWELGEAIFKEICSFRWVRYLLQQAKQIMQKQMFFFKAILERPGGHSQRKSWLWANLTTNRSNEICEIN